MTKDLIRKYIWLIDTVNTVNTAGWSGITLKEISAKWERNDRLSGGEEYPRRSFHNHVAAVRELFGIEIACHKNTNSYYIANSGDLKDSSGFKGWLLDALSLNSQLEESSQLKDRILLEEIPSGKEFLPTVLEAMHDGKMLTFSYKPFWVEDDYVSNFYHVEPYALKVDAFQSKYLRTLPLHPSQEEVERTEDYSIFTYFLRPTFDFIQELLSLGITAEVLSPKTLRKEISRIGKTVWKLNG